MDNLTKRINTPELSLPRLSNPMNVRIPPSPAEQAFETLARKIAEFEKTLSEQEAVGSYLASFGQSVHLQIQRVTRAGQFICMEGVLSDGSEASIVQHFTQT